MDLEEMINLQQRVEIVVKVLEDDLTETMDETISLTQTILETVDDGTKSVILIGAAIQIILNVCNQISNAPRNVDDPDYDLSNEQHFAMMALAISACISKMAIQNNPKHIGFKQ